MTAEYNSEVPMSMEDGSEMTMTHGNMEGELYKRINCKQMSNRKYQIYDGTEYIISLYFFKQSENMHGDMPMTMMMAMSFEAGTNVTILFKSWKTTDAWTLFGSVVRLIKTKQCIIIFGLFSNKIFFIVKLNR